MRHWFAGLGLDIRLAFRLLRQQPGFAFISIAMIALAIAASTSLFSVVNGVLLKPLPKIETDGLMRVFLASEDGGEPVFTNVAYYAWKDAPATIDGPAAWNDVNLSYEDPSGLELVRGARVTANLFPVIGIAPMLGVHFTEEQEVTDDAVMLSYGFWKERVGGSSDALGSRLTIGGKPRTVVGVMPAGFSFPDRDARVWLPQRLPTVITVEPRTGPDGRTGQSISIAISAHNGLARLQPGVTAEQAAGEGVSRLMGEHARHPRVFGDPSRRRTPRVTLTPMLDLMVKDVKPALWILSAAVILLFAAAVGNVASMQLSRAAARGREVAIRSALGAGGARLARQLLVETSTVAAIGGALGLWITSLLLRVLPAFMPEDFPRLDDIAVDARVLAAAAGLTMAVALVTGLLPARLARRVKLTEALVEDGAAPVGQSLRSPSARSRALIITAQVAIASLLLVGAGLLAQSLYRLVNVDRGYEPENLLTARVGHLNRGLPSSIRAMFFNDVLERLTATPGVTHAAFADDLPVIATVRREIHGAVQEGAYQRLEAEAHVVSTDYVAAMGMRLLRGRGFTSDDVPTSELVVLVNEAFARRYLPAEPLHTSLALELDGANRPCPPRNGACTQPWRVVGIVADVRHDGPDAVIQADIFAPRTQFMTPMPGLQYVTVRTTGNPAALAAVLRSIVKNAGSGGAIDQVQTLETRLMMSLARPRLYAALLGGFATFALLIAGIGLFGGLSYSVTQRTREIGVRTALGATPRDIVGLVVRQGALMTIAGLTIGFLVAGWTGRYLSSFLFGVTPADPATFVVVGVVLTAIAAVACGIPARRAAKVDPIDALRH